MTGVRSPDADADVLVVGAGPGGSSTAYHLATHGVRVLMLERSEFPRGKVCGDGLTPRGVQQVRAMGVDITSPGWATNRGVRFVGGRTRLELDWPDAAGTGGFGLTRTRLDFDALLARRAVAAGTELCSEASATGAAPAGNLVGVTAEAGRERTPRTFRGRLVVAASGVSGRIPSAFGFRRQPKAPIGVAVRRYYRSPRSLDPFLEVVLDVPTSAAGADIAPGYGWLFPLGNGRVNVGLAVYDSAGRYAGTDHRRVFTDWLRRTPPEWGLADDANADGPLMGGAIPLGFSRSPPYRRGVLLVGDCAGMANPFTGEGIAYAMESGVLAAEVVTDALAVPAGARREAVLARYGTELATRYARYYRLGRRFVRIIDSRPAYRLGIRYVVPRPALMRLVFRLICALPDPASPDATDRVVEALVRLTPRERDRV